MKQESLQQFWEDCKRGVYNLTDRDIRLALWLGGDKNDRKVRIQ